MTDLASIAALVDLLRSKGVRTFHGAISGVPVILELGPPLEPISNASSAPPEPELDLCNCKCPRYAHVNGLCLLRGCDPESCAGPDVAVPQ